MRNKAKLSKLQITDLFERGTLDDHYSEYLMDHNDTWWDDKIIEWMEDGFMAEEFLDYYWDQQWSSFGPVLTHYMTLRKHGIPAHAAVYHARIITRNIMDCLARVRANRIACGEAA